LPEIAEHAIECGWVGEIGLATASGAIRKRRRLWSTIPCAATIGSAVGYWATRLAAQGCCCPVNRSDYLLPRAPQLDSDLSDGGPVHTAQTIERMLSAAVEPLTTRQRELVLEDMGA